MSPSLGRWCGGLERVPVCRVHHARVRSENKERPGRNPVFRNIGAVSAAQTQ